MTQRAWRAISVARRRRAGAVTWLTEASVAVRLIHADAVHARRRVAPGQLLLAVQSDVAGRARAVRPGVVRDHARGAVAAHHGVARVVLLLAKPARVPCNGKMRQVELPFVFFTCRPVASGSRVTRSNLDKFNLSCASLIVRPPEIGRTRRAINYRVCSANYRDAPCRPSFEYQTGANASIPGTLSFFSSWTAVSSLRVSNNPAQSVRSSDLINVYSGQLVTESSRC